MWNLKYDTNEIVYKTETDSQRTDFWLPGVRGDEGEQGTGNLGLVEGNGPHSSTLAWKIPWMEEPGRLQSMESLTVRHD